MIIILLLFVLSGALASGEAVIDTGDTVRMLRSTALVLLMVPGLAMFYGGLVRSKSIQKLYRDVLSEASSTQFQRKRLVVLQ